MENAPKVHASTTPADSLRDGVLANHEDWRQARRGYLELVSLGMPGGVNWLLVGKDGAIGNLLEALPLGTVLAAWRPGDPLVLPEHVQHGTVLLRNVEGLTHQEQLQVIDWLESPLRRARVVSTSSARLIARMRAGAFLDTLYYRLNTITIDITGA